MAYTDRALAYGAKGDTDRAIADFDAGDQARSERRAAFNNRGVAYRTKGDIARAIADYEQAIKLDPG